MQGNDADREGRDMAEMPDLIGSWVHSHEEDGDGIEVFRPAGTRRARKTVIAFAKQAISSARFCFRHHLPPDSRLII
jgi:hypothetical protein